MSRPMDLEKIKQAWQLRRQGNQQKNIAEALDLSLRHVQNYLSIDWLAQRSLRALMKGRAEEANEQLKTLGGLGEVARGNNIETIKGGVESPPSPNDASGSVKSLLCEAPTPWPDVAQLETWGVPRYEAPGLLSAWRRAHREDTHQLCAFWRDLVENVQAGIPFPDAYDLTIASWLAERWGYGPLGAIAEMYRLYRPWEEKVNRKVYLEEVRATIGEKTDGWANLDDNNLPLEELPRRFLYALPRVNDTKAYTQGTQKEKYKKERR